MESPKKRPGYPFKMTSKDKEALKKEITKRNNAGDNSNVDKTFGPIAGSAKPSFYRQPMRKPKPKQDITKIPGFQFGGGTE